MQNNDILDLFNQLTDFQKERIQRELRSYIQFNEFVESSHYAHCPVCGIAEPKIIKKGFLNGKQRVECQTAFISLSKQEVSSGITLTKVKPNGRFWSWIP